jgi:hypothetical protein
VLYGSAATCRVDLLTQQVMLFHESSPSKFGEVIDSIGDEWHVESEFLTAVQAVRRGDRWQVRPDFVEAARYMRKMQAIHDSAREAQVVQLPR